MKLLRELQPLFLILNIVNGIVAAVLQNTALVVISLCGAGMCLWNIQLNAQLKEDEEKASKK